MSDIHDVDFEEVIPDPQDKTRFWQRILKFFKERSEARMLHKEKSREAKRQEKKDAAEHKLNMFAAKEAAKQKKFERKMEAAKAKEARKEERRQARKESWQKFWKSFRNFFRISRNSEDEEEEGNGIHVTPFGKTWIPIIQFFQIFFLPGLVSIAGIILGALFSWWLFPLSLVAAIVLIIIAAADNLKALPMEGVGMIELFGKPVAFFKEGSPFMGSIFFKITIYSKKNVEVLFGVKAGNEIAIGCASFKQAEVYESEFKRIYIEATYGNGADDTERSDNANKAWTQAKGDTLNNIQTLFKPEISLVWTIGTEDWSYINKNDDGSETKIEVKWWENILNFHINVDGSNWEEKVLKVQSQLRENILAGLNSEYKKFTYSMLSILMGTDALDNKIREVVTSLMQKQEMGLILLSARNSALGAPKEIHEAQNSVAIALQNKEKVITDGQGVAEAAKLKTIAEGEGNKSKLIAEGEANANATRLMNTAEIDAWERTIQVAKDKSIDPQLIIDAETQLEMAKAYANGKGSTIIRDHGNSSNSGNDNSVSTVLLVQALQRLTDAMSK